MHRTTAKKNVYEKRPRCLPAELCTHSKVGRELGIGRRYGYPRKNSTTTFTHIFVAGQVKEEHMARVLLLYMGELQSREAQTRDEYKHTLSIVVGRSKQIET